MSYLSLRYVGLCFLLVWLCSEYASLEIHADPLPVDPSQTDAVPLNESPERVPWSKKQKLIAVNAAATVGVGLYGRGLWGYGGNDFKVVHEGWFDQDTAYGGADKLGHAYSSMVAATALAELYTRFGYESADANLYGALSSMYAFVLIEVGDASSKHGFSPEDIVADACGVTLGYVRRQFPEVGNKLDFRVEYIPTEAVYRDGQKDLVTDYSGYKYLLALKGSGFSCFQSGWGRYLEWHVGYYTRGFTNRDEPYFDEETRHLYTGIGVNLSHLFGEAGYGKTSTFLNYYQIPYTYGHRDWEL